LATIYTEKIKTAQRLTDLLNTPAGYAYYRSIEQNTKMVSQHRHLLIEALESFKSHYPSCLFCDIAFVIGALSTGGIMYKDTIVIGLELFTKTATTNADELNSWVQNVSRKMDYLPAIVIHELVHLQQFVFLKQNFNQVQLSRLLDLSIIEGTADFVCSLVLKGKFPNDFLHPLADPQEKLIWQEFKQEMMSDHTGKWLYKRITQPESLTNLGYYIGYKIVESYFNHNGAKAKALQEIIELQDPLALLTASDYDAKF